MEADDLLGLFGGFAARAQAFRHHLPKIVHGVEIDVVQLTHLRFDIAGYSDIHHEDGAMLALLEGPLHGSLAEYGQWAGGGGDENIHLREVIRHFGQGAGGAVEPDG